jgi:hypothetical protein
LHAVALVRRLERNVSDASSKSQERVVAANRPGDYREEREENGTGDIAGAVGWVDLNENNKKIRA